LIFPSFLFLSTSAKSRNASEPNSTFSIRQSLKQTSMFLFQRGQHFIQRMGEGGDAIGQQFLSDFPRSIPSLARRLNLLEPRLVESHTTGIIPFDDRVIFVRLLNCAEFSTRLSEVAQPLDAISGIQFLAGGRGLGERRLLGTV
jgi:hypothetical protein